MAITTQDFDSRMDVTGLITVTGSEMMQIVEAAKPADDKGLRIVTTDSALNIPVVPNPDVLLEGVTPTHWYRYKWVRKPFNAAGTIREYNWNILATADATYLKWQEFARLDDLSELIDTALGAAGDANTHATTANVNAANALAAANDAQATANAANGNAALVPQIQEDAVALEARVASLEEGGGAEVTLPLPVAQGGWASTTIPQGLTNYRLNKTIRGEWYISDVKASGSNGGLGTVGIGLPNKRVLNTSLATNDAVDGYVTLNSDSTFTLTAPATYIIEVVAPAYKVGRHKVILRDNTNGVNYAFGSSAFSNTGAEPDQTISRLVTRFTLAALINFQINHIIEATAGNTDLGVAGSFGVAEVYTQVKITLLQS